MYDEDVLDNIEAWRLGPRRGLPNAIRHKRLHRFNEATLRDSIDGLVRRGHDLAAELRSKEAAAPPVELPVGGADS
eukprot:1169753-Prorocentrum_lima.AAC.1